MNKVNYKFFTRPSASFSLLGNVATDRSMLETELELCWGKGQIGGWKLFLNSFTLVKKN